MPSPTFKMSGFAVERDSPISRSFAVAAIFVIVFTIFLRRSPTDIVQPVVGRIAVKMPAFHSFGTRSGERDQDDFVDGKGFGFPVTDQVDARVIPPCCSVFPKAGLELVPFLGEDFSPSAGPPPTPDGSVSAGAVALIAGDLLEFRTMLLSNDSQLLDSWGSGQVRRSASTPAGPLIASYSNKSLFPKKEEKECLIKS
jgi:hypothetical protein